MSKGSIDLEITDRAAAELKRVLEKLRNKADIVTLLWGTNPDGSDPGWSVMYYHMDQVPPQEIVEIRGVKVYIPRYLIEPLRGRILDFVEGFFSVIPDTLAAPIILESDD